MGERPIRAALVLLGALLCATSSSHAWPDGRRGGRPDEDGRGEHDEAVETCARPWEVPSRGLRRAILRVV